MRRRILTAIAVVAGMAVVLFAIPLAVILRRSADDQATLRLERTAVSAARQLPNLPTLGDTSFGYYDARARLVSGTGPARGDAVVRAALRDQVTEAEVPEGRVTAIPVGSHEKIVGALRAAQPTSVVERDADRISYVLVGLALAVVTIGALAGSVVAGRLARPVQRLRDDALRLGAGDFRIPPVASGIREIDDAHEALRATAAHLADLMARERAFSADASHQLRTPLAALRTSLETELAFPSGEHASVIAGAVEEVGRLEATIDDLLEHARAGSGVRGTLDVSSLVEATGSRWALQLRQVGRRLDVDLEPGLPSVRGSEPLLRQALDCLLDNAVRHGEGTVTVTVRSTDDAVAVAVADEGAGFAPDGRADADAAGHGIGLSLARRLVDTSGGRLVIADPGPRPVVQILLLRAGPAAEPPDLADLADF